MSVRVLEGDCRAVLAGLPDASVQCVVTSPPYWGLRDYGQEGQLGLEKTPEEYVARMVEVFREVRRVLRDDGTLWLNLGDSYGGDRGNKTSAPDNKHRVLGAGSPSAVDRDFDFRKQLVGIPWRVAFALQADGWYLRSEIIWHKPNPMPESVTDRPTKAHEQMFLLTKSERYYYDADAVREPHAEPRAVGRLTRAQASLGDSRARERRFPNPSGRNRRTVWTVATQPYSGAHFATFPPALIEPCILAGSSNRACEHCGAAWVRVVEGPKYEPPEGDRFVDESRGDKRRKLSGAAFNEIAAQRKTIGWEPSCDCPDNHGTARSVVLDPFGGAGTTGLVADRLRRDAILVELNPEYAQMARDRITNDNPLFTDVA
jgi:DNA modification methylase